jgi:hypothetical protein
MDSTKFDAVARTFGTGLTRRSALRGLVAGAVAVVGGATVLEADAKRRRKKGKGGNQQRGTLANGQFCQTSAQCRDANNICEVASNASNSDRTCCGAAGATCGAPNGDGDATAPFCCAGFSCTAGTCQPVPDDI